MWLGACSTILWSHRLPLSSCIGGVRYMIMDDWVSAGPSLVTACGRAMIHSAESHHGDIVIAPLLQLKYGLI